MAQNHVRLQKMVTHNANEMQSYLKDLNDWSSEMNSKEEKDQNIALAEEHKLLGNQFIKEKKYDQAIQSYTQGINFDPNNAVLYANRAQAFLFLKKYDDTVKDCNMALSLNPTPAVKSKIVFRRNQAYELNKTENLDIKIESEYPKIVHPIDKPPHKQSKRPILPIPVRVLGEQPMKRHSLSSLPSSKLMSATIASSQSMDGTGLCSDLEQLNTKEIPPKPVTSVQFMISWKLLKEYPTVRAHYLQTMAPADYEIFKDSMETSTLSEILDVLVWEFLPRKWNISSHLAGLLRVRRLGTLLMFMPEKDRANVRKLISTCDDAEIRNKYTDTFTI